MPESPTPPPRFPLIPLLAAFLGLGLFVGATAAICFWNPNSARTASITGITEVAP